MKRINLICLIGTLGIIILSLTFNATRSSQKLSTVDDDKRLEHAKELLGFREFEKSFIAETEGYSATNNFVLERVRTSLPSRFKSISFLLAKAIIDESALHGFDPLFVLAIIEHESKFDPVALGGVGEIGLMQIRPETGQWIARLYKKGWKNKDDLRNPIKNVILGIQYLAYLRDLFGHGRLYLSAYNMGPRKVRLNLSKKYWPKVYSLGVMKKYLSLNKNLATQIAIENLVRNHLIALK